MDDSQDSTKCKVNPLQHEDMSPTAPPLDGYITMTSASDAESLMKQQRRLEAWDRDLQRRERALVLMSSWKQQRKNWPKFCPLIYHDIQTAIPINHQPVVFRAFSIWRLGVAAFVFNWWIITLMWVMGDGNVHLLDWCFCCFALLCGVPLSFMLHYYPIYQAAESGDISASNPWRVLTGCSILWSLSVTSGIPALGHSSAGIWQVISFIAQDHNAMALLCFSNSLLWICLLTFQALLYHCVVTYPPPRLCTCTH